MPYCALLATLRMCMNLKIVCTSKMSCITAVILDSVLLSCVSLSIKSYMHSSKDTNVLRHLFTGCPLLFFSTMFWNILSCVNLYSHLKLVLTFKAFDVWHYTIFKLLLVFLFHPSVICFMTFAFFLSYIKYFIKINYYLDFRFSVYQVKSQDRELCKLIVTFAFHISCTAF